MVRRVSTIVVTGNTIHSLPALARNIATQQWCDMVVILRCELVTNSDRIHTTSQAPICNAHDYRLLRLIEFLVACTRLQAVELEPKRQLLQVSADKQLNICGES